MSYGRGFRGVGGRAVSSLGAGRTWRRGAGARREGSNSTEERFPLPVQPSGEATVCFFFSVLFFVSCVLIVLV